ncbi:MAG: hypothetical protein ACI86M_000278 [Saprospiraceae bacterium]|jgi:hypothetical protein
MKVIKQLLTINILAVIIFASVSCGGNDPDTGNPEGDEYYMTAEVDGVEVSISEVRVSAFPDMPDAIYSITALSDDAWITIILNSPSTEGTFSTPEVNLFFSYTNPNNSSLIHGAQEDIGTGTIAIEEITSKYIKGTFSFTGVNPIDNDTKEITNGKFKAQQF